MAPERNEPGLHRDGIEVRDLLRLGFFAGRGIGCRICFLDGGKGGAGMTRLFRTGQRRARSCARSVENDRDGQRESANSMSGHRTPIWLYLRSTSRRGRVNFIDGPLPFLRVTFSIGCLRRCTTDVRHALARERLGLSKAIHLPASAGLPHEWAAAVRIRLASLRSPLTGASSPPCHGCTRSLVALGNAPLPHCSRENPEFLVAQAGSGLNSTFRLIGGRRPRRLVAPGFPYVALKHGGRVRAARSGATRFAPPRLSSIGRGGEQQL